MSKSETSRPRSRNRLVLGAILLLVLLGTVVGLWLIFGRPAQALDLGPAISISTPVTGDVVEVGTWVQVTASGDDALGVTRLELYVNGVLTAVQENDLPDGSTFLDGFDSGWTPVATGRYILMARGYRADGRFADSGIVLVDVVVPDRQVTGSLTDLLPAPPEVSCPSLNQLAAMLGVSLDDLLLLNPDLRGTDASRPLDCGVVMTLPRPATPPPGMSGSSGGPEGAPGTGGAGGSGGPTVPAPLPGSPTPPAWVAVDPSACTSVRLTWTASPDAEGYTLYRNAPGYTRMNAVAHLPAGQTTYADTISLAGRYIYQVAAARGGMEALSAVFTFNTGDYPACAASLRSTEPPAGSSLYLIMPILQVDAGYEGVYCYLSMNGGAQGRLPQADFTTIAPMWDGSFSYDLRTPPARGRYLLTRSGGDPVTIEMECMGRRGVISDSLGGISVSHPGSDWDGHELTVRSTGGWGAFTINYCITTDPSRVNCISSTPPELRVLVPTADPVLVPIRVAADLPAPSHLRFENNILWGPGNHLVWDWTGAGPFTESTLTGYEVSVTGNSRSWIESDVTGNGSRKRLLSGTWLPCGTTYSYQVTAIQGVLRSPPSAPLSVTSAACPDPTRARVLVIFESMTLSSGLTIDPLSGGAFDAGDLCIICRDNEFELWFSFRASSTRHPGGYLEWQPNDTGENFVRLSAPGTYDLAQQRLSSEASSHGRTSNNIIVIDLIGGPGRIFITGTGVEYDALGFSNRDCAFTYRSPEYSPARWQDVYITERMGGGTSPFEHSREIHDDQNTNLDLFGTDTIMCALTVTLIGMPLP